MSSLKFLGIHGALRSIKALQPALGTQVKDTCNRKCRLKEVNVFCHINK